MVLLPFWSAWVESVLGGRWATLKASTEFGGRRASNPEGPWVLSPISIRAMNYRLFEEAGGSLLIHASGV
jgi:hypothetical protein